MRKLLNTKKIEVVCLIVFMLLSASILQAQVANYSFTQQSGTYTAITGGAVLGTVTSDETYNVCLVLKKVDYINVNPWT